MELQEAIQRVKQRYQTDTARINEEKAVIEKFGFMFHPDNLDRLTAEDFKSFLLIKNNKHWTGIHRQGNIITSNLSKLKTVLKLLLDESKPLKTRLDDIIPRNRPPVIKGLGRAVLTPILFIVYPGKYAVYNSIAEKGMDNFGILPKFQTESFAEKYLKINGIITEIAEQNGLSLWQIDDVWWEAGRDTEQGDDLANDEVEESGPIPEKLLQGILVNSWDKIPEFNGLEILQEDGESIGEYFNTKEVGEIDVLCRNKTGDYVVIELKSGRESDKVVGQTLRYISWVKKNMAKQDERVYGLIITHDEDLRLKYALEPVKDLIQLKLYEISITIRPNSL